MKCLKCDKEMQKGYLQSNHQIFYTTKKHKYHFSASKEDIRLTDLGVSVPEKEVWCCKECRMIIINY